MPKTPVAFALLAVALVAVAAVPAVWAGRLDAYEKEVRKEERNAQRELKDADRDEADEQREDARQRGTLHATRRPSGDDDLDLKTDDTDGDLD